ncbi:MAG: ABC transporter substrate-binding protein [Bacilli bacterium]
MIKKIVLVLLTISLVAGCSKKVEKTATTIRFYGWSGDVKINTWLDTYVKDTLKKEYNINFERVVMDAPDIITMLANEKEADKKVGEADIVWINGANFAKAKEYDVLSEINLKKIPNYSKNIDENASYLKTDFGEEISNLEVPYGIAQFTFVANTKIIPTFSNTDELMKVAKDNPGVITYPAVPDFTGSAFIRNVAYDIIGYEKIDQSSEDKEELRKLLTPVFDYLNAIEPYLWQEGKTYPKEEAVMQKMYGDSQLGLTMSYTALLGPRNISDGTFPKTSESFVFKNGNISNSHYLAIPFNSDNKDKSHQVLNFILSAAAQSSKLDINNWGDLTVLTYDKLEKSDKKLFDEVYNSFGENIKLDEITKNNLPEVSGNKTVIIDELWEEEVLNK